MKHYELLLFDADGTLFDYHTAEKNAFHLTMTDYQLSLSPEEYLSIYHEINRQFWKEYEVKLITIHELHRKRFKLFVKRTGIPADPDELGDRYLEHLAGQSQLLPGAVETCKILYRSYKMSLITNGFTRVQKNRLADSPIGSFFSSVTVSEEAGVSKPDRAIFEQSLIASGVTDKSRVLIIGDGYTSDIAGGNRYGIDTCWYNPGDFPVPGPVEPTRIIRKLEELLTFL